MALPSAIVNTFTYNGDGQRVQKIDSTGTTKHVWDGQNILLETDGSNIIQVVYTLQPCSMAIDLATPERDHVVLFVRRAGFDDAACEQRRYGDRQLYLRFDQGNLVLTSGSTANCSDLSAGSDITTT